MFGIVHYEMFLLAGILLNLTPGSDTIYVLSRSIAKGCRVGFYSALGISTGTAIHTLLAAFGLSVILAQSVTAFNCIKIAGAIYLAYLGITALFSKKTSLFTVCDNGLSNRDYYFQGILTNVLNPKVALFFLSFLPQFIDPQNDYGALPFVLLGVTFLTTGTLWCFTLAYCSSGITDFLRRKQKVSEIMNRICGGIYILLGIKLLTVEK